MDPRIQDAVLLMGKSTRYSWFSVMMMMMMSELEENSKRRSAMARQLLTLSSMLWQVYGSQEPSRKLTGAVPCAESLEAPQVEPGDAGVVVEDTGWHGEVLPTSLVLLAALGLRDLTVYKATSDRDRDRAETMRDFARLVGGWGLRPRWRYRAPSLRTPVDAAAFRTASLVLFQSPEYNLVVVHNESGGFSGLRDRNTHDRRVLDLEDLGPHTRVLLGCHNFHKCKQGLLRDVPCLPNRLRRRLVVFFWSLRSPSLLPFYLGPPPRRAPGSPPPRRLLLPGSIVGPNAAKRDYAVLATAPPGLAISVFGDGVDGSPAGRRAFARLVYGVRRATALAPAIGLAAGSYGALLQHAHAAGFVLAPLRDAGTYRPRAKMSSAINIALATGQPLITNALQVTQLLGCPALTYCSGDCHTKSPENAPAAYGSAAEAFEMAMRMNGSEHAAASHCMLKWRAQHFCKATGALQRLLASQNVQNLSELANGDDVVQRCEQQALNTAEGNAACSYGGSLHGGDLCEQPGNERWCARGLRSAQSCRRHCRTVQARVPPALFTYDAASRKCYCKDKQAHGPVRAPGFTSGLVVCPANGTLPLFMPSPGSVPRRRLDAEQSTEAPRPFQGMKCVPATQAARPERCRCGDDRGSTRPNASANANLYDGQASTRGDDELRPRVLPRPGLPTPACVPSAVMLEEYPRMYAARRAAGRVLHLCTQASAWGNYAQGLPLMMAVGLMLDLAVAFENCDEGGASNYKLYLRHFDGPHFDWHAPTSSLASDSANVRTLPLLDVPTRRQHRTTNATLRLGTVLGTSRGFRLRAGPESITVHRLLADPSNSALARQKLGPQLSGLSDGAQLDGCLLRYLLQPSQPMSRALHSLTAHMRIAPSGLLGAVTMHARLGDSVFGSGKDWAWKDERKSPEFRARPGGAFRCLQRAAHISTQWGCLDCVVVSDSAWTGQCARALLRRPLVTAGAAVHYLASDRRSATSELRSETPKVLVDWWLLAQSEKMMFTAEYSSFSNTASYYRAGWDGNAEVKDGHDTQGGNKGAESRLKGPVVKWKGRACARSGAQAVSRLAAATDDTGKRKKNAAVAANPQQQQQQLRSLSKSAYRAYVDEQSEALWSSDRLVNSGLWLTHRYRRLWMGSKQLQGNAVYFVSVPWQELFENTFRRAIFPDKQAAKTWNGSRASHPRLAPLRQLMELWRNGLDWQRPHFVILNQLSLQQMNFYARQVEPTFSWTRENLVVFDTRLWNLAMTAHNKLATQTLLPVPLLREAPGPHYGFATDFRSCRHTPRSDRTITLLATGSNYGTNTARGRVFGALQRHLGTVPGVLLLDGEKRKLGLQAYRAALCRTRWFMSVSGTFPPTFMIYEALQAGALPIFAYAADPFCGGWLCNTQKDVMMPPDEMQRHMPFFDEGVRFNDFGALIAANDPQLIPKIVRLVNQTTEAEEEARRGIMLGHARRFTPKGTFDYALRAMRRLGTTAGEITR